MGNSLESIKGPELPQELIFCVQTGQERQATPYSRVSRREAASQGAMAVPGSWQALRVPLVMSSTLQARADLGLCDDKRQAGKGRGVRLKAGSAKIPVLSWVSHFPSRPRFLC